MLTVVQPEHRGHRLGLAVKLANLDALARQAPGVRLIVTGNAAVNGPMIAVNDMMGFEVAGEGLFWQKRPGGRLTAEGPAWAPTALVTHEYAECVYTHAMKAGILGASGYTGSELLRLLAGHPEFEVAVATAHSHAGEAVGAHTPSLAGAYPGLVYEENDPARFDGLDLVFCGLPHGESQRIVPELRVAGRPRGGPGRRLPAEGRRALPAVVRRGARRAASCSTKPSTGCPSCSATAWPGRPSSPPRVATRRQPAWPWPPWCGRAWWSRPASSSTPPRACRAPAAASRSRCTSGRSTRTSRPTGLLTHRHTPEMEQIIGGEVLFTPHLAPMVRGILATCYARPTAGTHADDRRRHGRAARRLRRRALRRRDRRRRPRPRPRRAPTPPTSRRGSTPARAG